MEQKYVLSVETVNIFFDESGTKNDKPTIMGGLLIPTKIYNSFEFQELNRKLRENKFTKLHWTDYTGYEEMRKDILEVLTTFAKFSRFVKLNVINYNANPLDIRKKLYNQEQKAAELLMQKMIYTKIPERILYGLLRNYGKDVYIKSQIFIEKSNRYEGFKLDTNLMDQLNIQSMYRGEQFSVLSCSLKNKREEIGIEITDLLLGIVRQIIKNEVVPEGLTEQQLIELKIKGRKKKIDLAVELLKNKELLSFLSTIKYYEWESNSELKERNFQDYLNLFLTSHYRKFEEEAPKATDSIKRKIRKGKR
ncbi:DUF3800 domain-containing protein [Parageobacillus toebii]|nr:hypothetical protein CN643_16255 [Parageobacillus yumthangensis]RDV21455.1 DUF3800 domain-containing protein [Parageobacillus toebii]